MDLTDKLHMMSLLPGLYISRDTLLERIATIEAALSEGTTPAKRRGRPPNAEKALVTPGNLLADFIQQGKANGDGTGKRPYTRRITPPHQIPGTPEHAKWVKQSTSGHTRYWAKLTPEQRAARIDGMKAGRYRKLKAAAKAAKATKTPTAKTPTAKTSPNATAKAESKPAPRKIDGKPAFHIAGTPENLAFRERMKEAQLRHWDNMTAKEKAARQAKMIAAKIEKYGRAGGGRKAVAA